MIFFGTEGKCEVRGEEQKRIPSTRKEAAKLAEEKQKKQKTGRQAVLAGWPMCGFTEVLSVQVRLSDRLKMSVDLVDECGVVADIGCDHAHTCIWLIQNGRAGKCIGMDLRTGPIQKARENLQLYECTDRIDLRLSFGLDELGQGEADTIVIAGMGGEMIRDILDRDAGHNRVLEAEKPPVLILQPHSHVWDVRQSIYDHGYAIVDESMCREDDKFYPAIKAVRADCLGEEQSALHKPDGPELYFGPVLLARRDPILSQFLEIEHRKKKYLLDQISLSDAPEAAVKKQEVEGIYGIIREARVRMGMARDKNADA